MKVTRKHKQIIKTRKFFFGFFNFFLTPHHPIISQKVTTPDFFMLCLEFFMER